MGHGKPPEKSRWGRMNSAQSWTRMAKDMDRAFAASGMTTHEATLMQYVRENSWDVRTDGPRKKGDPLPDPVAVPWHPGEIAGRIGSQRVRISEAKDRLVKSRMLIEVGGGLMVNKHAHQWVIPDGKDAGKPRLSEGSLAYAMSAWPRPTPIDVPPDGSRADPETTPEAVRKSGQNGTDFRTDPPTDPRTEIRTDPYGNPDNPVRKSGQNGTDFRTAPIEDRAGAEPRLLKNEELIPPSPPTSSTPPDGVGGGVDPAPPQRPEPAAVEPMASNPAPPEFVALCRRAKAIPALEAIRFARTLHRAWNTAGGADLTNWWLHGNLPAKAWEDALIILAGRPANLRTVGYFVGIAVNPRQRAKYERADREEKARGERDAEPVKLYQCQHQDRPRVSTRPPRTPSHGGGAA